MLMYRDNHSYSDTYNYKISYIKDGKKQYIDNSYSIPLDQALTAIRNNLQTIESNGGFLVEVKLIAVTY